MMEISNEALAKGLARMIVREPRLIVDAVNSKNVEKVLEEIILEKLPSVIEQKDSSLCPYCLGKI
jgi:hypothetical protein